MPDKPFVHQLTKEECDANIETLKVGEETLSYLRKKGFKTVKDFVDKQDKVPKKHRVPILKYLIFGIDSR